MSNSTKSLFRVEAPATKFRGSLVRFKSRPPVERDGGKWGAGLIRGVSLCTRGEALGHWLWLDTTFIRSCFESFASVSKSEGLKARFTHPDLSADGLGHYLGRYFEPRIDDGDNQVFGDLHFAPSAHDTPDGDLAAYLMTRAEEDPLSFGLSIVFQRDVGEEDRFYASNEDEAGDFTSPDAENTDNIPHARLAKLWGCDAVDEPAANPNGLFHRGPALTLEATAAYALGLSNDRPVATALDVDPDRLRDFARRFLSSHGLQLSRLTAGPPGRAEKGAPTVARDQLNEQTVPAPDQATPPQVEAEPAAADPAAADPAAADPAAADQDQVAGSNLATVTLRRYLELFGDRGGRYLADGLSVEEAYAAELSAERIRAAELASRVEAAEAQLADAQTRRTKHATGHLEETKPLKTGRDARPGKASRFSQLFRIQGKN